MSEGTYLSSEDSALLRSVLTRYAGEACLEIGAGNGGGLVELARGFGLVVGSDLLRPSTDSWKQAGADFVLADAASCFREGAFDMVTFNPPYVPSVGIEDVAVDGGAGGAEVLNHFLGEAMRAVRGDGRIVMLLSSDNPVESIAQECERRGFVMKSLSERRLFYETLAVCEVSRLQS
ncbi:MAG: methyltransferase domain-containing protein [Nitrososphaerales archaeon]|nr:methyltransferase domain-containing protein [Nitrososphaerales archaeon]